MMSWRRIRIKIDCGRAVLLGPTHSSLAMLRVLVASLALAAIGRCGLLTPESVVSATPTSVAELETTADTPTIPGFPATTVPAPPAPTTGPCYTIQTGTFGGYNISFGLDEHHQVVTPDVGVVTSFEVDFQACPELGHQFSNVDSYLGRILLHTSSFVGANTCLTVNADTNFTDTYYAKAETCGSDVTPPSSQVWIDQSVFLGLSWAGDPDCPAGYLVHPDTLMPHITSGTHIVLMSCDTQADYDLESFQLTSGS